MKTQKLLGLMLASSVALASLAGCASPVQNQLPGNGAQRPATGSNVQPAPTGGSATTTKPGTISQFSPAKQQAAAQNSQATADAMNDEQDMNAYDAMASEDAAAMYSVFVVGAPAPAEGMVGITAALDGEVKAETGTKGRSPLLGQQRLSDKQKEAVKKVVKEKAKLVELKKKQDERRVKQQEQLAKRLDKMKDVRGKMKDAFKGGWVAGDEEGTEKKTHSFSATKTVNGKTMSRSVEMIRVRSKETKALLSAHVSFSQELPNGLTRTSTRDKVLQEDGSYLVTFHSELTLAGGAKRVVDWTKTIAADGSVTGTGTIVWTGKDGKTSTKTVTLAISGKEEAETTTATDAATGTEAEVAVTAAGDTTAAVTDTEAKVEATVEVKADVDAASADAAAATTVEAGATQGIAVGEPNPAAPAN